MDSHVVKKKDINKSGERYTYPVDGCVAKPIPNAYKYVYCECYPKLYDDTPLILKYPYKVEIVNFEKKEEKK